KLHAKMAALAKDKPKEVIVIEAGGTKVYQIKDTGYAALLDKNTLALAQRKEQALELVAKAAGKKKTKLALKEMAAALKTLKADVALQAVALESTVSGTSMSITDDGMGKRETKVKFSTLGEEGFKGVRVTGTVDKAAKLTVVLTPKGKEEM